MRIGAGSRGSAAVAALVGAVGLVALVRRIQVQRLPDPFAGKVALVTGGSRGLGLEIARRLVDEGAAVAIVAREPAELQTAVAELGERGGRVVGLVGDVTIREDVDRVVAAAEAALGRIDLLVNNAGMILVGPAQQTTLEDYRAAMDLHFWAPLYLIKAVAPGMKRRGGGHVVNVSSIGGLVSVPHLTAYSATKHALVGLSDGLRAELADDGIHVTTVCPGILCTGSARHAILKGDVEKEYAWFAAVSFSPLTATSSERAAKLILQAVRFRRPRLVIGGQARALDVLSTLSPGMTATLMRYAQRALPPTAIAGEVSRVAGEVDPFRDVRSKRGFAAALENNELHPPERARVP